MTKVLKNIKLSKILFIIGVIASLMTIDSWLESKYSKQEPSIKYEYNYYINNIESTEYKSIYYKK